MSRPRRPHAARRRARALLLVWLITLPAFAIAADKKSSPEKDRPLALTLRKAVETSADSGRYHVLREQVRWDPRRTALVICDMWDEHWCKGATRRVAEMAPRMNDVVRKARTAGVFIIHCPSGTMDFYKDHPARKRAQAAPKVATKIPLEGWCHLDPAREGPLPIDDKDGGCDCRPMCKTRKAWSRQIAAIEISDEDAITDSAEAYYLMRQRGIKNVIVMGVHTNMCVLGRPFSIRQMVYQGQNVVLMRDLTDTMYNPRSEPRVSHFTGTDLVVSHIERHWCPTVTSVDFLGGAPLRFANDKRKHLVIVMAEAEYETDRTLPKFALAQLGHDFRVSYVFADHKDRNDLPGIEVLARADVALLSIRRRVLPPAQMKVIRDYVAAGKPVVGIRTASHAFALRKGEPPAGYVDWPQFDRDVFGGNYTNHYGNTEQTFVRRAPGGAKHPVSREFPAEELRFACSLYKTSPLSGTPTVLLTGRVEGKPPEPAAWTNRCAGGGRSFYTSLGHPEDFKQPAFVRLLRNGIYWAAGLPVPEAFAAK